MPLTEKDTAKETGVQHFAMLSYGAPGSGKTYLGAHAPNPYFISLDDGLTRYKFLGESVKYIEPTTFDELEMAVDQILNGQRAKENETIVLDHGTAVTDLIIDKVLTDNNMKRMDQNRWGIAVDHLKVLLRKFTDIPKRKKKHAVMLFHEQVEKNEIRGGVFGNPNTVGKLAYYIGGYFDLYLYHYVQNDWKNGKPDPKYFCSTVKYGDFSAKDRIGVLPSAVPNDLNKILALLESAKPKEGRNA